MASSYQERNQAAMDAGWDSLYYQTEGRREAREILGDDVPRETIWEYAEFQRDFDGDGGQFDIGELRDIYEYYFGEDYDDQDFYDWLGELYEQTAG